MPLCTFLPKVCYQAALPHVGRLSDNNFTDVSRVKVRWREAVVRGMQLAISIAVVVSMLVVCSKDVGAHWTATTKRLAVDDVEAALKFIAPKSPSDFLLLVQLFVVVEEKAPD